MGGVFALKVVSYRTFSVSLTFHRVSIPRDGSAHHLCYNGLAIGQRGQDTLQILFVGDVVGKVGRTALAQRIGSLRRQWAADFVVVNGENAAGGAGITPALAEDLFRLGVDVVTLGNHSWDKRQIVSYIEGERRLLRPLNFPPGTPGFGSVVVESRGRKVAVVNAHGRVFASVTLDDPFRALDAELARLQPITPVILVDFHAEATSEKVAMGWYLDGRVSAVVGTHTHVQTADARVLPGGTAYITDVGMCGPRDSVIGMERNLALERFLTQMPVRLEVAPGPVVLCGACIEVDLETGRAAGIQRIQELVDASAEMA